MIGWDLSCRDWEQRLRDGRSLVPDLPLLDVEAGDRAVAVFNKLRLADVKGTPTMAEAGGDWFRDIVRALFGSIDRTTLIRYIVELFCLVPKKNSKTTNGALLMLTALLLNERPRAPFALMAPVHDTAEEAFQSAAGAIELDGVLAKKFHVRHHLKTIVHRETNADLQIMTFDPDVLTGKKFVGTLIDELHVIAKNAKAAQALRQVRGGMLPFPEAFLAFITTMPDGAPVGVMRSELDAARAIRDGTDFGKTLTVLYEFPRAMQADEAKPWMDPKVWPMVNPNLGRSVSVRGLQDLYDKARAKGESDIRGWASQHLNVEIGVAIKAHTWAGAEYWEGNARKGGLTLDQLLELSEVVTVGVDGGGLDDLLGLNLIGRERGTGCWLTWSKAWAHRKVLERRKEIASQLEDLEKAGELTIVDTPGRDVVELADIVERVNLAGLLPEKEAVGVDPVGIGVVVDALVERGITNGPGSQIIGISQGYKMVGAIKTAERKLAEGNLQHGSQRLMAWCVGNAKQEPRGNAVIITKEICGSAKIDPLMAMFDAVSLMSQNPEAKGSKKPQLFFV